MNATYDDRIDGIATSAAVKAPVRAATTVNITLSGEQTLDGIAVVTGDRALVKNQTDTTENGIYVVDSSTWARAEDFDGNRDTVKGTRVWIVEGSVHAEEEWNCTSADPIVIGTDAITWEQSPLQDAVDAAEAAQVAAEAAAASVSLPVIGGGDAGKGLKVNAGETAYEFTASAFGSSALIDAGTSANEMVQLNGSAQIPAVDGSLLTGVVGEFHPGFLFGLILSNDTDTLHDINVTAGKARDDADSKNIILAAEITKRIDAGWAVGDDQGGLDTGAVAIDTTYHVFLIERTDGTVQDVLFSLSATSPTMPGDYTISRRIGAVLTDGSADIRQFTQWGDRFSLNTPETESSSLSSGAEQTLTLTGVPSGIQVLVELTVNIEQSVATTRFLRFYPLTGDDLTVDDTNATVTSIGDGTNLLTNSASLNVLTNTSAQIHYRLPVSAASWVISIAWIDTRGRLQ